MSVKVRNLAYLRNVDLKKPPEDFGARLHETLTDIINAASNIEQQTNANASGLPTPPPPPDSLNVAAQDGIFHVSVKHNADIYRGVKYHVEYANDPNFTNPFPLNMGDAREHRTSLGNQTLYFRAAASYDFSAPSQWVYYGGASPSAVSGGGNAGPSLPSQSQGSGTGYPGQGLQGPGQFPFRSNNGVPPTR